MANASKYDLFEMRINLTAQLLQHLPFGDPETGEGYECFIDEDEWSDWILFGKSNEQLSRKWEHECGILAKQYQPLDECEHWALVRVWLEQYYSVAMFEFRTGQSGGQERRDKQQANRHLKALALVLGKKAVRRYEDEFCESTIRPQLGLRAYEFFMHGGSAEIEEDIQLEAHESFSNACRQSALPVGAFARQMGRGIYDRLLKMSPPGVRIEYSEELKQTTLSIEKEDLAVLVFNDEGFLGYRAARDICRGCVWVDPNIWKHLERVLSESCGQQVDLDGIEK